WHLIHIFCIMRRLQRLTTFSVYQLPSICVSTSLPKARSICWYCPEFSRKLLGINDRPVVKVQLAPVVCFIISKRFQQNFCFALPRHPFWRDHEGFLHAADPIMTTGRNDNAKAGNGNCRLRCGEHSDRALPLMFCHF